MNGPTFAIWFAEDAPRDEEVLKQTLEGTNAEAARVYGSVEEWLQSNAAVFVIRGTDRSGTSGGFVRSWRIGPRGDVEYSVELEPEFEPRFHALRGRRVIGIGYQATRAFGMLGLSLCAASATFQGHSGAIFVASGALVAPERDGARMLAFDAQRLPGGKADWTNQAIHLPRCGALAQHVEALARWTDMPNYAPIVREQSILWSGIAADARTWTEEFRKFLHDAAWSLAKRPLEPFTLPQWDVAGPGTYHLTLAPGGAVELPYEKEFYLRFGKPVLLSAHLEIESGRAIELFLHPEASPLDGAIVESRNGEALDILVPITERSIRTNKGRCWEIEVVNFGTSAARGQLTIQYDEDGVIALPGGIEVPLTAPPRDPETISRVITLLSHEDPAVERGAEAALLVIGTPALNLLDSALNEETQRRAQDRGSTPPVSNLKERRSEPRKLSVRIMGIIQRIQEHAAVR